MWLRPRRHASSRRRASPLVSEGALRWRLRDDVAVAPPVVMATSSRRRTGDGRFSIHFGFTYWSFLLKPGDEVACYLVMWHTPAWGAVSPAVHLRSQCWHHVCRHLESRVRSRRPRDWSSAEQVGGEQRWRASQRGARHQLVFWYSHRVNRQVCWLLLVLGNKLPCALLPCIWVLV